MVSYAKTPTESFCSVCCRLPGGICRIVVGLHAKQSAPRSTIHPPSLSCCCRLDIFHTPHRHVIIEKPLKSKNTNIKIKIIVIVILTVQMCLRIMATKCIGCISPPFHLL